MLTIYGVYRSRASRTYWMALELGLEFESVPVIQAYKLSDPHAPDARQNTASPDFLAINPMGRIPVIDDDGLILTQSLANNLHLARKHGGPLSATSLDEEALFGDWTMWAATDVEPQAVRIVLAFGRGTSPTAEDQAAIAEATLALAKPFDVLEAHLRDRDYLVGDRFTVADLNVAEVVRYASPVPALFAGRPRLSAWLARCQARPAYQAMLAARTAEPA